MNKITMQLLLQIQTEPAVQSTQKFEVVVAVIALVFLGIVAYLVRIDKKLSKLERK